MCLIVSPGCSKNVPSHKISQSISTAKGIFWNSMETFLACLCHMVGRGRQWHLLTFGEQDPDYAQPPAQLLKAPSFIMVQSRTQFHIRYTHRNFCSVFRYIELLRNATTVYIKRRLYFFSLASLQRFLNFGKLCCQRQSCSLYLSCQYSIPASTCICS